MSFLSTIRGLGRSSKKNKKDLEPTNNSPILYTHSNYSGNNLKRSQSPTKILSSSPSKLTLSSTSSSVNTSNSNRASFQPSSPSKRNRILHPNQQQQQQQQQQQKSPLKHRQSYQNSIQNANSQNSLLIDPPLFLCEPYVKMSLVKGSFKTIVTIPKYVDYYEWLAINVFEMFNNLNRFYGVVQEYVTPDAFPTMNAGPNTNYLWVDSSGQAINLPACQYIDYVVTWISNKTNDQSVFPTKSGGSFPPNFIKDCKNICRQLFRIFAFIYYNQFETILHLTLEAHWNSFFAHFISFNAEFNLLDKKELEPLRPLIEKLQQLGKI
ncbi:unnamed protein product [Candida verbasci]|uniref:Uncharacterized protein n=1 Tax=Candida verbasci TaxID=1227364 RepID=A0A9W4TXU3_9ASCO|nr:unnamed protein product [Candida verbasci]